MHFLDFRAVLDDMAARELAPYGPVRSVQFVHRNHTDVYRIRTDTASLIAHATADGKAYLKRVRSKLDRLTSLRDPSIPHPLAWRAAGAAMPGREWAVLVYWDLPGEALSRRTFTGRAWQRLGATLERLHALEDHVTPLRSPPPKGEAECRFEGVAHDPANFPAFARALTLRLGDFPVRPNRVRAHLDAMAEYVDRHAISFETPPRLIHGDLDRRNIVVRGDEVGLLDWADLDAGDYAFDLAMLKFMLDSVAPAKSATLIRDRARRYRDRFQDPTLELRLRFFLALAGLVHAFHATGDTGAFKPARAWRVRTSYLHSESQWRTPLQLDGAATGAPAVRTEQWALDIQQPLRGLVYLVAPKKVA